MTNFYQKMLNLEESLTSADLDPLNEIITLAQEKANRIYKHQHTDIVLNDEDIISKYKNVFKTLIKRSMDTPLEHIYWKGHSISDVRNKVSATSIYPCLYEICQLTALLNLMTHIKKQNINSQYICELL